MIKTVKCPDCGGEQAVFRNENGNMNCAFCGKEIELPEAVEGEVEGLPEEDETLSAEPVGDPVECEFILNKDEVETALFATGRIKKRTTVLIIETVVLAIFIIVTAITVFAGYKGIWGMNRPNGTTWFTLALAVLLVPAVWIMPERNKRKMIEASVTGTKVALKVYENLIEVNAEGADSWQMIYDEKYRFIEKDGRKALDAVRRRGCYKRREGRKRHDPGYSGRITANGPFEKKTRIRINPSRRC